MDKHKYNNSHKSQKTNNCLNKMKMKIKINKINDKRNMLID